MPYVNVFQRPLLQRKLLFTKAVLFTSACSLAHLQSQSAGIDGTCSWAEQRNVVFLHKD